MPIAAIDIGSNAIRLIIAQRVKNQHFHVISKYRAALRLGEDVFTHGKLTKKTLTKAISTFRTFRRLLDEHDVSEYRAVATSALRDASNQKEVLAAIAKASGIQIEVIDGTQEAQLIFSAVKKEVNLEPYHVLLMDIGGGSVELTVALRGVPLSTQSFPLGTVRLLGQMKKRNLKEADIPFLLLNHFPEIQTFLNAHRSTETPLLYAIGTGGNLEAMGKLKAQILRKHPASYLTLDELERMLERIRKIPLKDRPRKLGLRKDRADVIIPALLITKLVMLQGGVEKIVIPYVGLKDGLLTDMIMKDGPLPSNGNFGPGLE